MPSVVSRSCFTCLDKLGGRTCFSLSASTLLNNGGFTEKGGERPAPRGEGQFRRSTDHAPLPNDAGYLLIYLFLITAGATVHCAWLQAVRQFGKLLRLRPLSAACMVAHSQSFGRDGRLLLGVHSLSPIGLFSNCPSSPPPFFRISRILASRASGMLLPLLLPLQPVAFWAHTLALACASHQCPTASAVLGPSFSVLKACHPSMARLSLHLVPHRVSFSPARQEFPVSKHIQPLARILHLRMLPVDRLCLGALRSHRSPPLPTPPIQS